MKHALLLTVASFWLLTGFSQTILFDQTSGITNNGTVAQDFEAVLNTYDCMGADDFQIPGGETWYLDSIVIYGFYAAQNNDPFTTVGGFALIIYQDNNGTPGSIVYSDTLAPNQDPNQDGSIAYFFQNPLMMTGGTYWIAAAARKDFSGGGGQYYWYRTTTGFGNDFLWQNPGNGFSLGCTSWANGGNCLSVTEDGLAFRVFGCYSDVKPQINDLPEDTTFCAGPVLTLTASSPSSNVVYVWSTGQTGSTINVSTTGYYRVWALDTITECGNYTDIGVEVVPPPDPGLSDVSTCDSTYLINAFIDGGQTYLWHDGSTGEFYNVTASETVSVTVTDTASGCTFADTAYIAVSEELDPVLNVESPYGLCDGDTVTLFTTAPFDGYAWSTGSMSNQLTVSQGGTYTVTVANGTGCTATASVDVVEVPAPAVSFEFDTLSSGSVAIIPTAGYQSYVWNTGATSKNLIVSESGLYEVTVTDEYGCTNTASAFLLVTGVEGLLSRKEFRVFPNPANEQVTVRLPADLAGNAGASIFDQQGRLLLSQPLETTESSIDISTLSAGHYILEVNSPKGTVAHALIIQ